MKRNFAIVVKSVIIKDDKALCLIRSDKELRESRINTVDLWDLPGGGLQYFEKIEDGLMREIKEETSLETKIIKPIDAHDIIKPHLHIVFMTYLNQYIGGEVVLSNEHKAYEWVTEQEILSAPIQKWLQKIVIKAFSEYRNFSSTM